MIERVAIDGDTLFSGNACPISDFLISQSYQRGVRNLREKIEIMVGCFSTMGRGIAIARNAVIHFDTACNELESIMKEE